MKSPEIRQQLRRRLSEEMREHQSTVRRTYQERGVLVDLLYDRFYLVAHVSEGQARLRFHVKDCGYLEAYYGTELPQDYWVDVEHDLDAILSKAEEMRAWIEEGVLPL